MASRDAGPSGDPAPATSSKASPREAEAERTYRIGWRMAGLGWEFVSHILAGTLIGWGVDHYFATRRWGIAIGAFAGLAVGMLQFIRAAARLNAQLGPVKAPPEGWKHVPPPAEEAEAGEGEGGDTSGDHSEDSRA